MSRRILWDALKYMLAFGLLTYVVASNWNPPGGHGLRNIWVRHVVQGEPIHYGYLLLAAGAFLLALLITFIRWFYLVRAQGLPFRFSDALRLGLVGFFFNTFLPGSVGGDIVKAAFLAREQSRRTVAVATVLMDRAIALWGLIGFVTLTGSIFWIGGFLEGGAAEQSRRIIVSAATIVVVSVVVWALLGLLPDHRAERFAGRLSRIPKVGGSAAEFWRAVWMYRKQQRTVGGVLVLSWVGHVGFVLAFYFSALTLWDADDPGQRIPLLAEHFLMVPIGLVLQAIPLFPGGAGIGEYVFGALYARFGGSEANGILGSLVQRVICWVLGLLGYLVYLRMRPALQTQAADLTQPPPFANGGFRAFEAPAVTDSPISPALAPRRTS